VKNGLSFPLTLNNGFHIRPGHKNVVSLSMTKISADERIRCLKTVFISPLGGES
jgi:hypothetical protein